MKNEIGCHHQHKRQLWPVNLNWLISGTFHVMRESITSKKKRKHRSPFSCGWWKRIGNWSGVAKSPQVAFYAFHYYWNDSQLSMKTVWCLHWKTVVDSLGSIECVVTHRNDNFMQIFGWMCKMIHVLKIYQLTYTECASSSILNKIWTFSTCIGMFTPLNEYNIYLERERRSNLNYLYHGMWENCFLNIIY